MREQIQTTIRSSYRPAKNFTMGCRWRECPSDSRNPVGFGNQHFSWRCGMVQTVSLNPPGAVSHANLASNAFYTPETARFIREILEKALTNPVGVAPRWV